MLNQSPRVLLLQIPPFVQHLRSFSSFTHNFQKYILNNTVAKQPRGTQCHKWQSHHPSQSVQPMKMSHLLLSTPSRAEPSQTPPQDLLVVEGGGENLTLCLWDLTSWSKKPKPESPSVFQYKHWFSVAKGGFNMGQRYPYETKAVYDYPILCHIKDCYHQ